MPKLLWDQVGQRVYETGVDHGVLYLPTGATYSTGVAWNGLVTVTESPSGAESNKQYADNIAYLNLTSAEEFGATVEAFTYPLEFAQCDGTAVLNGGVALGQQSRRQFGLSYRTKVGNDTMGGDYGYKLHLIYGAQAAPSEKAFSTVNDSPEPITFSWELTTTAVEVGTIGGTTYKPTAVVTIDSTKVPAANLQALEDALYGTVGTSPRLPLPAEVVSMFAGTLTEVSPVQPTFTVGTGALVIPATTGVVYSIDGVPVTGTYTVPAASTKVVVATPAAAYRFKAGADDDFSFTRP